MTRRRASEGEPAVLVRDLGARMREVGGRDGTIGQDARRQTGQRRLHAGVATRLKGIREGPRGPLLAWPRRPSVPSPVCVCVGGVQVLSPRPRHLSSLSSAHVTLACDCAPGEERGALEAPREGCGSVPLERPRGEPVPCHDGAVQFHRQHFSFFPHGT